MQQACKEIHVNFSGEAFADVEEESVQNLIEASDSVTEPSSEPTNTPATQVCSRPRRRCTEQTLTRMREIREWENCSETSTMFRSVADSMNAEFDNLNAEEREEDMQSDDYNASEAETSDDENTSNLSFVDSDSEETVNDDTEWIDDVIDEDSDSASTTTSNADDHDDEDPMLTDNY